MSSSSYLVAPVQNPKLGWSSGGAEYAKNSAIEFGIDHCFIGFLPKPEVAIDDMGFSQCRNLLQVHPNECSDNDLVSYKEKIIEQQSKNI